MKARILISASSRETGDLLKEYLTARGVQLTRDAHKVISYGVSYEGALNGACGRGKLWNMQAMKDHGVRTVPWWKVGDNIPDYAYPLLARAEYGYGGTDIAPVFQSEELPWRIAAGASWFSKYVPLTAEYRVWVWRDEVLDTYQKVMKRPHEYKYIGRNFRNGFDFVYSRNEADVSAMAIAATKAIELDFAAVDCIRGKSGLIYILEVNSAPGVIKSGAQVTLARLADKMVGWLRQ